MLDVDVRFARRRFAIEATARFDRGVTAIVGESGAGKSTLLRLIAGLDRPNGGRIMLGARALFDDTQNVDLPAHQRRIGMVFQHPRLLSHISVRDNVRLGAQRGSDISSVLDLTGAGELAERPVSGLSGGERQRVMLARALAGNPDLLLLDEPFSALNEAARLDLTHRLRVVLDELDIPVLLVSHAFDETAWLASNFVLMADGKVMAQGTGAEIFSSAPDGTTGAGAWAAEQLLSSVVSGTVVERNGALCRVAIGAQHIDAALGELDVDQKVVLRLFARDLIVASDRVDRISARNQLEGTLTQLVPMGGDKVRADIDVHGQVIAVLLTRQSTADLALETGQSLVILFKVPAAHLDSSVF